MSETARGTGSVHQIVKRPLQMMANWVLVSFHLRDGRSCEDQAIWGRMLFIVMFDPPRAVLRIDNDGCWCMPIPQFLGTRIARAQKSKLAAKYTADKKFVVSVNLVYSAVAVGHRQAQDPLIGIGAM